MIKSHYKIEENPIIALIERISSNRLTFCQPYHLKVYLIMNG